MIKYELRREDHPEVCVVIEVPDPPDEQMLRGRFVLAREVIEEKLREQHG